MRDILQQIQRWQSSAVTFALATVVDTSSSAPRGPGAALALHPDGTVLGSVSGGCVEGAVVETCRDVLSGARPQLTAYGYSNEDALEVGLTCGGQVDVFVQTIQPAGFDLTSVASDVAEDAPVAVATIVDGSRTVGHAMLIRPDRVEGSLDSDGLDVAVADDARGMLAQSVSGCRHYGPAGERRRDDVTVFIESLAPRPQMLVFGAIDFASAVSQIGDFLGFRVTVCDAREPFATRARFPNADEVVVQWPHRFLASATVDERTAICVLTHDPKFDVPVLLEALRTPAAFIGVMGSRKTHEDRLARLREEGVQDTDLERIRAPIGLDLGGRTPEETAVSIAAEIIQRRWNGTGRPLSETTGPIHTSQ